MIFLQLFFTFFKIGLFGFGGGYGMLSLIQTEVVINNKWLSSAEFTNVIAISQMTPGPIGINTATYCGYTAVATCSLVLPTLILMILISKLFMKYMNTIEVQSIFSGLRPAVVGLLAAATLLLMNKENFGEWNVNTWQFCISIGLFVATYVGTKVVKINPIHMILYAAFAGVMLLY